MDDVIDRMHEIDSGLPRRDGVAAFNRMYLQVSELLRDRLSDGYFDEPRFMDRLGVVFANLYFAVVEAADAGGEVPRPWAPLVEARRRRGVVPVQFALAGMNAHVNHDLAIAVVTTCGRSRRAPASVHDDYERMNELLATIVRPVRQSFLDSLVVDAGAPLSPLADLISAWSVETARDAAWVHALTLWELRPARSLSRVYRLTLARTIGLVGRQMLVAYGLPSSPASRGDHHAE